MLKCCGCKKTIPRYKKGWLRITITLVKKPGKVFAGCPEHNALAAEKAQTYLTKG